MVVFLTKNDVKWGDVLQSSFWKNSSLQRHFENKEPFSVFYMSYDSLDHFKTQAINLIELSVLHNFCCNIIEITYKWNDRYYMPWIIVISCTEKGEKNIEKFVDFVNLVSRMSYFNYKIQFSVDEHGKLYDKEQFLNMNPEIEKDLEFFNINFDYFDLFTKDCYSISESKDLRSISDLKQNISGYIY